MYISLGLHVLFLDDLYLFLPYFTLFNLREIKNNTNFGQITGIQEKLDTACK